MELIIEIQGFRDNKEAFVPKEVAIVGVNTPFLGHWILLPPYPFEELNKKSRQVNSWLSLNYHGIEWYDGEAHLKYFYAYLRGITRHTRIIYTRGEEKVLYLRNLLARNIYNLEDISPAFKRLSSADHVGSCTYHALRKLGRFHCALRNAYKLKHWLVDRNRITDSEGDSVYATQGSSIDIAEDTSKDVGRKSYSFESRTDQFPIEKEENKTNTPVPKTELEHSVISTKNITYTIPEIRRCLSSRPTTEGVDEVDRHSSQH